MRRIGLAAVLVLSLLFAALAGEVQQVRKVYRVGYLAVAPPTASTAPLFDAFVDGRREHGYVEGGTSCCTGAIRPAKMLVSRNRRQSWCASTSR